MLAMPRSTAKDRKERRAGRVGRLEEVLQVMGLPCQVALGTPK